MRGLACCWASRTSGESVESRIINGVRQSSVYKRGSAQSMEVDDVWPSVVMVPSVHGLTLRLEKPETIRDPTIA